MSGYKDVRTIIPNEDTINNILCMVNRTLAFFDTSDPVFMSKLLFPDAFTPIIRNGDGDFMTEDTIWDIKVSKQKPNKDHSLQLLMYYILGINSSDKEYMKIKKIGIFNPRLNISYIYELDRLDPGILEQVSSSVMGYGWHPDEYKTYYKYHGSTQYNDNDYVYGWCMKHVNPDSTIDHLSEVQKIEKTFYDYLGTEEKRIEEMIAKLGKPDLEEKELQEGLKIGTAVDNTLLGHGVIVSILSEHETTYYNVKFDKLSKIAKMTADKIKSDRTRL